MKNSFKLGIIGVGNMGKALLNGITASGKLKISEILIYDADIETLNLCSKKFKVKCAKDVKDIANLSSSLLIAVKPQHLKYVLEKLKGKINKNSLIISIAAGISINTLKNGLNGHNKIIRVMPNTPAMIMKGVSVFAASKDVTSKEKNFTLEILQSIGKVFFIEDEALMDAVTGLSGSGPAFIFIAMEALADGGVKMGLPRKLAVELSIQTVLGSAYLAEESKKHFGELKDMVTSPAGTTIAGIKKLEEKGFRNALIEAVEAAAMRSKELGKVNIN